MHHYKSDLVELNQTLCIKSLSVTYLKEYQLIKEKKIIKSNFTKPAKCREKIIRIKM